MIFLVRLTKSNFSLVVCVIFLAYPIQVWYQGFRFFSKAFDETQLTRG